MRERQHLSVAALFRYTPRIYCSLHFLHISFILHFVNAWYRSVKGKLEYSITFLQRQYISTGEMLHLLPSVLVVLCGLAFFKTYQDMMFLI